MEMGFRWDFAYEILPQMLWATLNTIIAAGVGYAIALVVGLFFLLQWFQIKSGRKKYFISMFQ